MTCVACGRGFHTECETRCKKCHPKNKRPEKVVVSGTTNLVEEYKKRGKTASELVDPKSTGRKRAAELYPLDKNAPCEWQGQKNCGGGNIPVIGCIDGKQRHRHHGPVKDTTRNQRGNVHRICTPCHNHWHELNDVDYEPRRFGLLPHDPEPATPEELVKNTIEWQTGIMKTRYELASQRKKKGEPVAEEQVTKPNIIEI